MLCEIITEILNKNRSYNYKNIKYEEIQDILANNDDAILLDVRSPQEYKEGHLDKSINIPFYDIRKRIKQIIPDKETLIIVYCQTGSRSKKAIAILDKLEYKNLYNLKGGIDAK